MATKPTAETEQNRTEMGRRAFIIGAAGTVAMAATASQVGASPSLDEDSDVAPLARAETTVHVEDVDVGGSDPLAFTDMDNNATSLSEFGARFVENRDDEGEREPTNPMLLRADRLDTDEYVDFPRGETDEDDDPISALDAEHWTAHDSDIDAEDATPASDGEGLRVSADAPGEEVVISFSEFDDIGSPMFKYLQLVVSVEELDGTVEVRATDESGAAASAIIDADADAGDEEVVATEPVDGAVFQAQVGDLASSLDEIARIEVAMDGSSSVLFAALNCEREDTWSFGEREVWDDDEEDVETEEWVAPVGEFRVKSLDAMTFSDGMFDEVPMDIELLATEDDTQQGDPSHPAFDSRYSIVQNIEVPASYSLSYEDIDVKLSVGLDPDQWLDLDAGVVDEPIELSDLDDEGLSDRTDDLDAASVGDDIEVGSVSSSETFSVYQSIDVTDDQISDIESSGVVGFGGGSGSSWLSTPQGVASVILGGLATTYALLKGWIGRLIPGA